jgi:dephospho-CoA kinase
MAKPRIIGVTGGIGGGKSTFSNILRSKGYFVYDSDSAAKSLQDNNLEVKRKITELFGSDIYTNLGLDRKRLADKVFASTNLLAELNKIVHPAVFDDLKKWIDEHINEEFLFVESALLFSSDLNKYTDLDIVVTAAEDVRIQRIMNRDKLTLEQAKARISSQLPEDENVAKADFVVYSDGKIELAEEKVENVLAELKIKTLN